MKLPDSDSIKAFALLGITDIQEMLWCLGKGLSPEVILTFLSQGVTDLQEMAATPKKKIDIGAPRHLETHDPFGLAGTGGRQTTADGGDDWY